MSEADNDPELRSLDIDERRERIAAMVNAQQFASVTDLARLFGVSPVTIRNDIDTLSRERQGLRRVRGGLMRGQLPYSETPYEARSAAALEDKIMIGQAAAAMVESHDTVILDVGTTTMAIAEALIRRTGLENVTIFTNGLNIALTLERAWPRISTVVTGGSLRPLQHSLVEPMATLILSQIRANIAFIGCNGIDPSFGVSTTNLPETAIKQVIIGAAHRVVVAADGSKFGRRVLSRVCGVDEVDMFLTAGYVDPVCAAELAELKVCVENVRPLDEPERPAEGA